MDQATHLARERKEQRRRWRLLPEAAGLHYHDDLLVQEFLPPEEQARRQGAELSALLRFCREAVPFYRERLAGLGAVSGRDAVEALRALPATTRQDLNEHAADLRAERLPEGDSEAGYTRTSGTTGEPITVHHSARSLYHFLWLKQRELRWWRFDPRGVLGAIRPLTELPRVTGGDYLARGQMARAHSWPYFARVFQTGDFVGFLNTTPVEQQLAFLAQARPDYLVAQSALLEHLALASQGGPPAPLRACVAVSQTLTPAMRATVEASLGVPVHQNYGLNEIGLVASRCPAGRYHVHAEHALVEIVDERGAPCAPGERGRLLVTGLRNRVMPLLRYDADDLAVAVEGPCPCGRTLPSFGDVLGRYRRIAQLPPGSWRRWGAIQLALHDLPRELHALLRRYQVHQHLDGSWVLRLHLAEDRVAEVARHVLPRFEAAGDEPPALTIVATDRFEGTAGKFQNFLSDYAPAPDLQGGDSE